MELGLDDRVILITGGSDGLGAAAAAALLREGARVGICARDRERLEHTAVDLRGLGGDVLAVAADVTDATQIERFLVAAYARWGQIDGLINNAGASSAGAFAELTDARWSTDLELKVLAAARVARLAYPHLVRSDAAAILNVLSISAKTPGAGSMPTSVSRAAGLAMTKALSHEWGPSGVRVNAALIGMVRSGQWERIAARRGVALEDHLRARAATVPLRRIATAPEFGDLAAFLMSSRSGYITGAAVTFDGGASLAI